MDDESAPAARRARPPAIGLIVFGALVALLSLVGLALELVDVDILATWIPRAHDSSWRPLELVLGSNKVFNLLANSVAIATGAFITYAGVQMLERKRRTCGQVAAVLAMIPCLTGCCFVLGVPLGVWMLFVLHRPDVRAAFAAKAPV